MRRIVLLVALVSSALPASGCGGFPGWYRAVGHFPGIAPSDYAFYNFCGTSSQVFQFPMHQVQGSAIEALRDLGFRDLTPAKPCHGSKTDVEVKGRTQDGRPVTITFSPQNRNTNMRFTVGPVHVGDELLARDLFRRVALNFGTLPRDYMPLEPTLAARYNPPVSVRPESEGRRIEQLEGEGFRPGAENLAAPEFTAPVTGTGSGIIPQPFDPFRYTPSTYPTLPYPFSPYLPTVVPEQLNPYP